MKTLVIEVHSLNKFQITKQNTPFLYSLKEKCGLGVVKPIFGYDIQTAFWTGTYPETDNYFAKYEYHKNLDKFNFINLFPHKIRVLLFNITRYLKGYDFFTNLCKHKYAKHFIIARKYHFFHKNAFTIPTLFDILRKKNKKFLYYQWPVIATNDCFELKFFPRLNDKKIGNFFIRLLKKYRNYDFYFLQLRDLDLYSHKYGPYLKEVEKRLKIIDSIIKKILKNFSLDKDNILIFSYFGMVPVKKVIDLESKLPKFGDGYIYFLDSTMARFWFFNDKVKQKVLNILKDVTEGHILSKKEKINYHVDFKDNRHFEELFLLNPGVIINPSFFHAKAIKGAHCYGLVSEEENGVLVANRKVNKKIELDNVMHNITEWLKLR
jgi:hypothetical protein